MKKKILGICIFLFSLNNLNAYHIVGGDFTCKWVGGNNFQVTMKMFRDCAAANGAQFDQSINVAVYDKVTHVRQLFFIMDLGSVTALHYSGNLCSPPPQVCVEQGTYIETITIPDNPHGYYLIWERCCRNSSVVNLVTPDQTGMGFYLEIADPALQNSSPVFLNDPLPYMCLDQPFSYNFGGFDQDGDSLSYEFDTPLAGGHTSSSNPNPYSATGPGAGNLIPVSGPFYDAIWGPGYSTFNIVNGNPTLNINAANGQMNAVPNSVGLYAMAVEMKEWRNGVQIGLVRRELEFVVITCNGNGSPNIASNVSLSATNPYVIYATDSVCIEFTATDQSDSLFITHSGDVFPGGTITGPYAIVNDVSGYKNVKTTFCWKPECNQVSSNPYHIRITVTDNGCPLPKIKNFDFYILVMSPPALNPPQLLCTELINNYELNLYYGNSQSSKFFSHYELYRSTNGGSFQLIDSIVDYYSISYFDSNAVNNAVDDYCYYVKTINVCNIPGVTSDTLCTLSQINLKTNYLVTASVNEGNTINLRWEHFPQGPFSTFYIYKKEMLPGNSYYLWQKLVHPAMDSIVDYDVNTNLYSYSYLMTNEDYCSNVSPESNYVTTMLLTGKSEPFVHTINWSRFVKWKGGVQQYDVYRKKDEVSGFELLLSTTDTFYVDKNLDVTGGAFTYVIKAVEGPGSAGALSYSNRLELVQTPLVTIPNAFTPNDDGVNETWKPVVIFVKDYSLAVFNRWGQRVFDSKNETESWDGKLKGKECLQGTYIYELKFSGYDKPDKFTKTGILTLIR